jgi:hypothetical protein
MPRARTYVDILGKTFSPRARISRCHLPSCVRCPRLLSRRWPSPTRCPRWPPWPFVVAGPRRLLGAVREVDCPVVSRPWGPERRDNSAVAVRVDVVGPDDDAIFEHETEIKLHKTDINRAERRLESWLALTLNALLVQRDVGATSQTDVRWHPDRAAVRCGAVRRTSCRRGEYRDRYLPDASIRPNRTRNPRGPQRLRRGNNNCTHPYPQALDPDPTRSVVQRRATPRRVWKLGAGRGPIRTTRWAISPTLR